MIVGIDIAYTIYHIVYWCIKFCNLLLWTSEKFLELANSSTDGNIKNHVKRFTQGGNDFQNIIFMCYLLVKDISKWTYFPLLPQKSQFSQKIVQKLLNTRRPPLLSFTRDIFMTIGDLLDPQKTEKSRFSQKIVQKLLNTCIQTPPCLVPCVI